MRGNRPKPFWAGPFGWSLTPECLIKVFSVGYGSYLFHQSPIGSFASFILVLDVKYRKLPLNPGFLEPGIGFPVIVLISVVGSEAFYLLVRLSLSPSDKFL